MICACRFVSSHSPRSAAYQIDHRTHHLEAFPGSDATTRASLDRLVEIYQRGEAAQMERLS